MLDFLYYLCIAPLETAMSGVLHSAYTFTGSWGVSLVLLSLAVNVVLIPVYHLAETWQEAERAIQKRMGPKLHEIKEVFSGKERYMYMRALYRLHDYSPVYALRTSFGLLIQIPFFFAAYHLLNAAPELAGASWLFIPDLAKPDALLPLGSFSINALPFVMTAANLVSAAVYTSRLTKREKVQLYGLAALFLILLYPSSAALLVYWTCNNLFSLGKNLVYTHYIYNDAEPERVTPLVPPAPLTGVFRQADLLFAILGIAAFVLSLMIRKRTGASPHALLVAGGATFLTLTALCYRIYALKRGVDLKNDGIARHYGMFPAIMAAIVAVCVWKLTSFKKVSEPMPWVFFRLYACSIGFMAGWLFARQPLLPLFRRLAAFCETRLDLDAARALFSAACITLGALVCWYVPATLYASDPDFFYEPFAVLFGRLTFRAVAFLIICALVYRFARPRVKPLLAAFAAWSALAALLFTFAAAGDYGTMDEFILQEPGLLKTRLAFLVDIAVTLAAAGVLWVAFRKSRKNGPRHIAVLLQGAAFALCIAAGYNAITTPANPNATLEAATVRLPDYNDELFGFSRDGKNTVVIMLDMFTGSHMERILTAAPELHQGLDGFMYYADTVAPGATTLLSIAALLGGEDYTPPAINARKPRSLIEELHKGFGTLPAIYAPKGYSVALADVDELMPSLFEKICPAAGQTLLVGKSITTAYTGYWREKNNLPSPLPETRAPFMASVGLFRAAPWTVRGHIYYDGSWLNTQTVIHNPSEGPYAMLDVLPEVANAKHGGNTLKYITSQVAHYPWRLDEATCMPVERQGKYTVGKDRVIHEHVVNEMCGLKALVRWFEWMKREGVYDNTLIILVSDHDGNDSAVFGKEFDDLRPGKKPWKPDALLLVKQRNSRGDLVTDQRPMSSADVVPLICAANGGCPPGVYPDPLTERFEPRVRTHSAGLASIRRHKTDGFVTDDFSVTGDSRERANWKRMEKPQ
ncbi:MAG: Membrane protein insertase YidC [Desulfovibrio sp.]